MPIENPNPLEAIGLKAAIVELDDGGIDVEFGEEEAVLVDPRDHGANLADVLSEGELSMVGTTVCENVKADLDSRAEWENLIVKGMEELGLKIEETSEPFEGACAANHPLLLENVVKFQSKAVQEIFPAAGPVRTRIWGATSPEKEAAASRLKEFLNYQILEEMVEYFDETERLLFALPLVGSCFRKLYFDTGVGRPVAEYVPVDQFVVSYNAPDLRRADRYAHIIYRTSEDLKGDMASGLYRDVTVGSPGMIDQSIIAAKVDELQGVAQPSNFKAHVLYEYHGYFKFDDLEETQQGPLPYVVTVDSASRRVLSVRRNWDPMDPKKRKLEWFVHYRYVPTMGFYGLGLIHLIGSLSKTATLTMRALVDAGMFANLQGGFKLKSMRVVGGNDPIGAGEWRDVDATIQDISKAIYPLPYKEPSQTLLALHDKVVAAGQKFADTTEQVIADSTNYGPVGTTLALLEASTKFFSATHKRIHAAQKQEFKILRRLDKDYLSRYPYPVQGAPPEIFRIDIGAEVDIIPSSDPNTPSNAHRLTRATTLLQMASQNPQMHDMREIYKRVYSAMEVDNVDKILPPPQDPMPLSPLEDIMALSQGKPIKAFAGQDHQAHIQAKMAFMQDPMGGGSPVFQPMVPLLVANIREHTVLQYAEAAMAMGAQGDQAQAQAIMQVVQQHVVQAQQAMAQQQPQDPTVQLGMAELQLRSKEHEDKMLNNAAQLAVRNRELDLRQQAQDQKGYVEGLKVKQKENDSTRRAAAAAVTAMGRNTGAQ
jgi:hypothetical protein